MKNDSATGQNPGLKVPGPCTGLTLTMKSSLNTRTGKNLQCIYAGDFTLFGDMFGEGGRVVGFRREENRTMYENCRQQPIMRLRGCITGKNLTEVEGMVIFFWIELFQVGVQQGAVHCRFIDDQAFVVVAGDINDRCQMVG